MKALMRIILASQSPRRHEILKLLGLEYEAIASDMEENVPPGLSPSEMVELLAHAKAQEIFFQYPDACVIGADTTVYIDGACIGKPRDDGEAARTLHTLQGRSHIVFTGVAVLTKCRSYVRHDATRVTFAPMTQEEIDWYIQTGEPRDKAGAYGIQGPGGMFVERVEGNYFNVIGMPVPLLYRMLRDAGAIEL